MKHWNVPATFTTRLRVEGLASELRLLDKEQVDTSMVCDALPASFHTITQQKWVQFLQPHYECVINFCFLFPQSHLSGGTVGHVQIGDLVTGIGKPVTLETGQDSCIKILFGNPPRFFHVHAVVPRMYWHFC